MYGIISRLVTKRIQKTEQLTKKRWNTQSVQKRQKEREKKTGEIENGFLIKYTSNYITYMD